MSVRTSLLGIRAFLAFTTCGVVACGGGVAAEGPDSGDAGADAVADAPRYPPECRAEDGRCKEECRYGTVFRDVRQSCVGSMNNVFCRPKISLTCSELNCWTRVGPDEGLRFWTCFDDLDTFSSKWRRCTAEELAATKNSVPNCVPEERDHIEPYD